MTVIFTLASEPNTLLQFVSSFLLLWNLPLSQSLTQALPLWRTSLFFYFYSFLLPNSSWNLVLHFIILTWLLLSCFVNLFYMCVFSTQEKAILFDYWEVGKLFLSVICLLHVYIYIYIANEWKNILIITGYFQTIL